MKDNFKYFILPNKTPIIDIYEIIIGKASIEIEAYYNGTVEITQTITYTFNDKKYKINTKIKMNPKYNVEKYLSWFKEEDVIIEHIPDTQIYLIHANH